MITIPKNSTKNFKYFPIMCNRSYGKCLKNSYDVLVVGGGIVGFATARALLTRNKNLQVALVEKEDGPSIHQSGHNSGVIHAGIYYKPGTMRAKMCIEGLYKTYEYCAKNSIPHKKCGKLIIATEESQIKSLYNLYERGLENGTPDIKMINGNDIKTIEPYCKVSFIYNNIYHNLSCYIFAGFASNTFTTYWHCRLGYSYKTLCIRF
jgi:L-2-hydroxyglutarate oxidase LhgO